MTVTITNRYTGAVILTSPKATIGEAIAELIAAEPHQRWLRGEDGGVRADLGGADLGGARNVPAGVAATDQPEPYARATTPEARDHPDVPVIEDIDARILDCVEGPLAVGSLEMSTWHTCETTHCIAGWAITLAGAKGKEMERRIGSANAGRALYLAATGRVPHFFASTDRALADLRDRARGGK